MLLILGRAIDNSDATHDLPFSEILSLDKEIQKMHSMKPAWLQIPMGNDLQGLSASALTRLVSLELIGQRARMVLHRRFLVPSRTDPRYTYSRQVCLAAATSTLYYFREIYEVSREPDGLLSGNGRFFTLLDHTFLLAAMILCLDIDQDIHQGPFDSLPDKERGEVQERTTLLETSYQIWTSHLDRSGDVSKATEVMRLMLDKIRRSQSPASQDTKMPVHTTFGKPTNLSPQNFAQYSINMPVDPRYTIDSKYGIGDFPTAMPTNPNGYSNPSTGVVPNMLVSGIQNFDWVEWDTMFPSGAVDLQT
jgi:hypothetical protein